MNYDNKTLNQLKADLIVDAHKGYPFLLAGAFYWLVMGVLSFFIEDYKLLALCYLIGSGSIFPIAIAVSKMLKVNMLSKNPLGVLGGITGGIQAFYLPIWIIIYIEHYELLPMAIGILGASHFLPYIWIYDSKTYGIFTVSMAVIAFIFGYIFIEQAFFTLPFLLAFIYLISVIGLRQETNKFIADRDN
ncbi:DUF7010 family protein [Virgibacillus sp. W0181]|uniref:DUF7010 family protein n=1 Tax=Virgibacillus sp. W0181 TaxID=3391581 RepID=UPI003F483872